MFIVGHPTIYENPSNTMSTSETKQEESSSEFSEFSSRQDTKIQAFNMKTIMSKEILTSDEEEATRIVSPQAHRLVLQPELSDIGDITQRHKRTDDAKCKNISPDKSTTSDDSEYPTNIYHFSEHIPEKCTVELSRRRGMKHHENRSIPRPKLGTRLNTKTKIMFVLTVMFIITTVCYISLVGKIANDDVLQELSDTSRTVYFFFLRLYFINHVVNPIVYGLLDPQFRKLLKQIFFQRRC